MLSVVNNLKFAVQETIKPSRYFVTHWQSDQYASMSYSFVPVGCTADAYEHMAEPVNNKIFFAGEVNCPTVYLFHLSN